ncbi:Cytoplasmic tRNA 2-thiolation protein 2 [Podosphaera aphanis]|nr:Cytoplasmic tRNA 2-thiolation protein 2 [Podosphaera aphanis]
MVPDQDKAGCEMQSVCKRCNNGSTTHSIRSENVCGKCFSTYITTKTIKRMETYRVRGSTLQSPKKLLLPLSFGPCSASLLYILDSHLQGQYTKMNKASYELIVIFIDSDVTAANRNQSIERLEQFKARFPRHSYILHGLEESLDVCDMEWMTSHTIDSAKNPNEKSQAELFQQLIRSMKSATAQADIIAILFIRLLVHIGLKNGCESILFGDSITKLAEKILTETAKGRGYNLPWQILDGPSLHGIGFNYPLRDVLRKELVAFSYLAIPSLQDLILYDLAPCYVSASSKSATIDDLMAQYFESAEENYPSIVANVVRTCSKLKPIEESVRKICALCQLAIDRGIECASAWTGNEKFAQGPKKTPLDQTMLCYGCLRLVNS